MQRRRLILSVILLLAFALIGTFASSMLQGGPNLSETYTSTDGSFTLRYPKGWTAETLSGGRVDVENIAYEKRLDSPDAIRLEISPPISIAQLSMLGQGTTPNDLVKQAIYSGKQVAAFFSAASGQAQTLVPVVTLTPGATSTLDVPIVNFTVNGQPAAWAIQSNTTMGIEIAMMTVYVDVGGDHVVSIFASAYPRSGGSALLTRYQSTILAIAGTIRYAPLPTPTGSNIDLPQTFTGTVGGWGMGEITFNYPADWYALEFVTGFIQNTQERLDQQNLKSGQMQAGIIDPASNMALIKDWKEVTNCAANSEGVTALAVIQKQLPTTPAQKEQVAKAGITYSQPESIKLNGKDAILLRIHQNKTDVLLIEVDLGNGNIAGLMAFAPEGEMSRYEAKLLAVAGTLSYKPKAGCNPPTARPAAVLTATARSITPSPLPTTFHATAVPGQKIAFVSANEKVSWQIFSMDTNGQNVQQLTQMQGLYGSIVWSPDGRYIAFVIFPNSAFLSLSAYVMKADGSDMILLSDKAEGVLSWSPDSRRIAFISKQSGQKQVYTIAIDGSDLRQITRGDQDVYDMMWSPDGKRIIFNRSDYHIYVTNADGTEERRLPNTNFDEHPVWSPDGKLIAFSSGRTRNGNLGELFLMNADGTQIRQLTNKLTIPTESSAPTKAADDWYSIQGMEWSPDGQRLAFFTKKDGVIDAFVIDRDGTNLRHIASDVGGLSWSPDSKKVVYSAGSIGKSQIFIADADGSKRYPLANSGAMDHSPMWSPGVPKP